MLTSRLRKLFVAAALAAFLMSGLIPLAPVPSSYACYTWAKGNRVGLKKGAEIRTGSALSYNVHTIVPEDNWQGDIIDGPRYADGQEWWDISRKNLDGGGTGWVYKAQAGYDLCSGSSPPPPAGQLSATVDSVWTADGNNNTKTSFNTGEAIRYYGKIVNSGSSAVTASCSWRAVGPSGYQTVNWSGNLTQNPGWTQWYAGSTVPQSAPSGSYTLTVSCTYNAQTSSRTANFSVQGSTTQPPGGMTVARVWTNDGGSDWSSTKTTFNRGDPVRYIMVINNTTGSEKSINASWDIRGPSGQITSWSGTLKSGTGEQRWGLTSSIPSSAAGGTYTFNGSVTYNGQTTSKSTNFTVNVPNPYASPISTPSDCNPLTGCVPREKGENEKRVAVSTAKGTCGSGADNWIVKYNIDTPNWQGAHRTRIRFYANITNPFATKDAQLVSISAKEIVLCLGGGKYGIPTYTESQAKASWVWLKK